VTLPRDAETFAVLLAVTVVVAIVNEPELAPAATVTPDGAVAKEESDFSVTVVPPVGALAFNVTVPSEDWPPMTELGLNVSVERTGGWTVSVAVFVIEPRVAVIPGVAVESTAVVPTVNVADDAPARTLTFAPTVAEAPLERSVTSLPPVGASPVNVTVPVEL
jgi:hypothetical protein